MSDNVQSLNLSDDFFDAAQNSYVLDYDSYRPGYGHVHFVNEGETLWNLASRYQQVVGADSIPEAARMIAVHNEYITEDAAPEAWQSVKLAWGELARIPMPAGMEVHLRSYEGFATLDEFVSLSNLFNEIAHPPSVITDMIRSLNHLDRFADITDLSYLYVPAIDDFAHITPLTPPDNPEWGRDTRLVILEWDMQHHRDVFEYAAHYAHALNPDPAIQDSIIAYHETGAGENIIDLLRSNEAGSGEITFSRSLVYGIDELVNTAPRFNLTEDTDTALNHNPTIFIPAGNDFENNRMQNYDAFGLSSRGYVIGAAHTDGDNAYLPAYSGQGADITAPPIPLQDGQIAYGTSFATPIMAAINHQMNEWYGNILTQEEIIAAAYMSTDMNIHDSDPYNPETFYGEQMPMARFETNEGGRPHHHRAGAGMLDPERWNENLKTMAQFKQTMEFHPEFITHYAYPSSHPHRQEFLEGENASHHVYEIAIPVDMTLDRLTLITPQDWLVRGAIEIESPSGFKFNFEPSAITGYGTSALALEDVRAGDVLTLRTPYPLSENAEIAIRGHEDGNVVQLLRDHLMEQGRLPQPMTSYVGATPEEEFNRQLNQPSIQADNNGPQAPSL